MNAPQAFPDTSRVITTPAIMMGDGSYWDYTSPETSTITIEDLAYGLAYTARFRGQTRSRLREGWPRVFYSVAEHCSRGAREMLKQGYSCIDAMAFLRHEDGEAPCGDMTGPMKLICPEFKAIEKRQQAAIHERHGVLTPDPALVKHWDVRMLRTEQRDLMPQSGKDRWHNTEDRDDVSAFAPFDFPIIPYCHPDEAAEAWLATYRQLAVMRASA